MSNSTGQNSSQTTKRKVLFGGKFTAIWKKHLLWGNA